MRNELPQRGLEEQLKGKVFAPPKEILRPNEIPGMVAAGRNLPEAWENAVLATHAFGCEMRTQYDTPEDPPSKVATMMMVIGSPLSEPRVHRCFPDSLEGLEIYTQEVVGGVHDEKIREGGWSYSYHDRLTNWPGVNGYAQIKALLEGKEVELPHIDQIGNIAQVLAKTPYSRRAEAITWNPLEDSFHHEPPCLQRIWCQVVESNGQYLLEMNTHWRSRDAFKAAFMNIFAITEMQRQIAQATAAISGLPIEVGRYIDMTDNFHLYGSYTRRGELEGFLISVAKRSFEQRTFRSDDPIVQGEFALAREKLLAEKHQVNIT